MNLPDIQAMLHSFEQDVALLDEVHFTARARAIDELEFYVLAPLNLLPADSKPEEVYAVQQAAESLTRQLEAVDTRLFERLRANIRAGEWKGTGFKQLIQKYVGEEASLTPVEIGYSALDLFIHKLLFLQPPPQATRIPEPEMVGYQPTPAHIIVELNEKAQFSPDDLFYDLGAGLGQVSLLIHLLSGVAVRGVEVEPAFCQHARACAAELHLSEVSFLQTDARMADYSDGTMFFMYTPFTGKMLEEVLNKLRQVAQLRQIKIFTYGPCTPIIAKQTWLKCLENGVETDKLGSFISL
ncbi:MAG TPA: class I SAM-dependent methyltransferase [Anaerolineales bacterium]|nr:class I SAM-dependent methyltransferase [Anaerolineales bacterium]